MGADAGQSQVGELEHRGDRLHRLVRGDAQPLEANVDLHEHVEGPRRGLGVGARAVQVHQGRGEAVRHDLARRLGQEVRVHQDRGADPVPAEPDALAEVGHAERIGPVSREHRAHLYRAEAVGIGLDHREDLPHRADELAHGADVRSGGIQVDLEGARSRRAGHGCAGHRRLLAARIPEVQNSGLAGPWPEAGPRRTIIPPRRRFKGAARLAARASRRAPTRGSWPPPAPLRGNHRACGQ